MDEGEPNYHKLPFIEYPLCFELCSIPDLLQKLQCPFQIGF